jgi:hypothetical protein
MLAAMAGARRRWRRIHHKINLIADNSKISPLKCHFPVAFQNALGHIAPVAARRHRGPAIYHGLSIVSGCSSVVEHDLAKVGVEGSNPFARSSFPKTIKCLHERRKAVPCLKVAYQCRCSKARARHTALSPSGGWPRRARLPGASDSYLKIDSYSLFSMATASSVVIE